MLPGGSIAHLLFVIDTPEMFAGALLKLAATHVDKNSAAERGNLISCAEKVKQFRRDHIMSSVFF